MATLYCHRFPNCPPLTPRHVIPFNTSNTNFLTFTVLIAIFLTWKKKNKKTIELILKVPMLPQDSCLKCDKRTWEAETVLSFFLWNGLAWNTQCEFWHQRFESEVRGTKERQQQLSRVLPGQPLAGLHSHCWSLWGRGILKAHLRRETK